MSNAGTQLVEPRPAPAVPAGSAPPVSAPAFEPEDGCFIINAPVNSTPAFIWPVEAARHGTMAELWERHDFLRQYEVLAQRCLDGEKQHYEACLEFGRAGQRHFEVHLYPGQAGGSRQAIGIIRDITARKRTESHLQLLLEIVHLLSVSPDLATATTSILKRLCAALNWPLGEVWLPTPNGAVELFSTAHRPDFLPGGKFRRDTAGLALRTGDGRLAELWAGGPVFIADLTVDAALFRAKAAARAGFRAAVVLPVTAGDQTLALMLFFLTADQPPDLHGLSLVQAAAAELGAVFQRERMQEQLDSFFNRSLDMHCLAGFDGFLKRANPAWTRILGYEAGELLARPLIEFVHAEDRPLFLENLAKLGHGEDLTAVEVRCLCRDGSAIWTLWNATSLPTQHLVIATARDITQRKRTETAVLQSEEHYRELFHQAYQMQENLRRMSDRILKIQEQERKRISRDLHDEVGQALTAINMNLAVLRNSLVASPPETERRISDTQTLIEQTMVSIHNFSRELRPAMLDDLGLLPALRNYAKNFTERTNVQVELDEERPEHIARLDSERRTVIYRIVQEGLNNVAKHAGAKNVKITITGAAHDVRLQVDDDGRGFALADRPEGAPEQLGLLGLAERVRLVGGEFSVASMPERGTVLHATIPFKSIS